MTTPAELPAPLALLALCCFEEANLEPDDGVAAVARVVLNRTAQRYESDGTLTGTILHPAQFSWADFDFVAGRYRRVVWTDAQRTARAAALYDRFREYKAAFTRCSAISAAVVNRTYAAQGEGYCLLGSAALLYDNLAVSQPPWATKDKLLAVIGHHSFFRA